MTTQTRPPTPSTDGRVSVEVQLEDLRRTYGSVHALDGLSLTLAPGELVALLGPSGCGKTTALRILAGLDEPTSGRVLVGGRDLTSVPANKRDMGMVFQAYSLFPHLSARENVEFGLKLRGVSPVARRTRALEMLELVGLSPQADRYTAQLSGGQQQRVALARALAFEPSVLLLDEPLSALDAKVRAQLRDEIRRVQLEVGTTTLFVTHDQDEALAMADRVGVMNAGRLEQLDAPQVLYSSPRNAFVADFVGLMNRVPAEVSDGQVTVLGSRLPTLPGSVGPGPGTALVRPEQLVLAPGGATGRIVALSFQGALTRARVRLPDGTELVVQLSGSAAAELVADAVVEVRVDATGLLTVPA